MVVKSLFVILLLLWPVLGLSEDKAPFRVAFWNVLVDLAVDKWADQGIPIWAHRRSSVKEYIKGTGADIWGFAETAPWQSNGIADALPGYERVQYPSYTDVVVFYNKNKFRASGQGWFFLSERPQESWSTDFGNFMPRMATWVRLRKCALCQEFLVVATHFDGMKSARQRMVVQLDRWIKKKAQGLPVILIGDFNIGLKDKGYKMMTQKGWVNTSGLMKNNQKRQAATRGTRQIDHILLVNNPPFEVKNWQVKPPFYRGTKLSDHSLVFADFLVPSAFKVSHK